MGIRETLNEKPGYAIGGIVLVVAVAAWFGWRSLPGSRRGIVGMGNAFYSIDDGKTWFVTSASHIAPFDYDGATAYQVQVFQCAHGGKFVAFMQRYADSAKAKIEQAIAAGQSGSDVRGLESILGFQVKKPADAIWVEDKPATSAAYQKIVALKCPDGTGEGLEKVDPND